MLQREFYARMCTAASELLDEEDLDAESLVAHDSELLLGAMGIFFDEEKRAAAGAGAKGVFQLLDQQSRAEAGNDRTLLAKIAQQHAGVLVESEEVCACVRVLLTKIARRAGGERGGVSVHARVRARGCARVRGCVVACVRASGGAASLLFVWCGCC